MRRLTIYQSYRLQRFYGLQHPEILQELRLLYSPSLDDLIGLGSCSDLSHLAISNARMTSLSELTELRKLFSVELHNLSEVTGLRDLVFLPKLRRLRLTAMSGIEEMNDLGHLTMLSNLGVVHQENLTDLTGISSMTGLKRLDLSNCLNLVDVRTIERLAKLSHLSLAGCRSLTDISALARVKSLQFLDLKGCESVISLEPLCEITSLLQVFVSQRMVAAHGSSVRSLQERMAVSVYRGDATYFWSSLPTAACVKVDHSVKLGA